MQFGLSEEQILLQDNVKRFLNDNASLDHVRKYAEGESDANIWAGLSELGVAALLIPEEHGGIGMTPLDAAIVAECLGSNVAPGPFLGSAVMAPTALIASGGDHGELLGELAAGTHRVGIAFGEAIKRRNDAGIQVSNGVMNGTSLFAFDAVADSYLVCGPKQALIFGLSQRHRADSHGFNHRGQDPPNRGVNLQRRSCHLHQHGCQRI